MKTKYKRKMSKKLMLSIVVLALVSIGSIAGIVTVLALSSRTIDSAMFVRFMAIDIDGEVEAAYRVGNVATWTSMSGETPHVFDAADAESNTQMNPGNIALTSANNFVEFRYTFRNFGDADYTGLLTLDEVTTDNNMEIWYKYNNEEYSKASYGLVVEGVDSADSSKLKDRNGTKYTEMTYYIKVGVKELSKSASYSSDFFWLLERYDGEVTGQVVPLATSTYTANGDGTYTASYNGSNISVAGTSAGSNGISNVWIVPNNIGSAPVTKVAKGNDLPANTKVVLSDSITTIENGTFSSFDPLVYGSSLGSQGLVEIVIGNGVSELSTYMFGYCSNLRNVTIGNGVTTINKGAFYGCEKLTSIIIPNTVTSIEGAVFQYCGRLEEVVISSSVTKISDYVFSECSSLKEIIIPNSVTSIDSYAFINCAGLKEITIPSSVTSIGSHAFAGCTAVEVLNYNASVTTGFSSSPFANLGENATKTVVNINSTTVPDYLFFDSPYIDEINLGSNVTNIGKNSFYGCTSLTNLIIPDSVTTIGDRAFAYCGNNMSVVIGSGITSMGFNVFEYSSLTNLEIKNGAKAIGAYAFNWCSNLTNIVIPDSVITIGDNAFSTCHNLTSVKLPNNLTQISPGLFNECWGLIDVQIPSGVTSIGTGAFSGCKSIKSITIPNAVTRINMVAFFDCQSLESITFENTTGWYLADSAGATSGTSVDVTSSNTNLVNWLTANQDYFIKYWKRG